MKLSVDAPTSLYEELLIQDRTLETLDVLWALDFWQAKRNPFFMDYVQTVCDTAGISIGPLLHAEIVKAANQRMRGVKTGTLARVKAELHTFDQLTLMVQMTYDGISRADAVAAAVDESGLSEKQQERRMGTLDKWYTTRIRNTGVERLIHAALQEAEHDSNPRQ